MDISLETGRMRLRRLTPGDLDALVALDADPEVMRFITGGRPTPREALRDDVLPALMAYDARPGGWGYRVAERREDGAFLGWFHLRPGPGAPADEPELGYRLARAAWGRGYATEGAQALVHRAFAVLGAQRVVASTMAVNTASRRVMERCGMRLVRTFHEEWTDVIPGGELGDVEYAVTRGEWAAAQGA